MSNNTTKQPLEAIVFKTDGTSYPIELNEKNSLETLQKLVGGLIEVVHLVKHGEQKGHDLIINEEGLLLELPINPFSPLITINTIWNRQTFFGDVVLILGQLP